MRRDFAAMASAGMNTVRTYTEPSTTLLDLAAEHGLARGRHHDAVTATQNHIGQGDESGLVSAAQDMHYIEFATSQLDDFGQLLLVGDAVVVNTQLGTEVTRRHGRQARLALRCSSTVNWGPNESIETTRGRSGIRD